METCLQDGYAVSTHLDRLLRRFVFLFAVVIVSSYSFLSYWEYSKEFYLDPTGWSKLLQGHGTAPQQYRVGVLFVAHFLSALTHGHLAMRHTLALLDLLFLVIGVVATFFMVARTRLYGEVSHVHRCALQFLALLLLLFYLSWTFWFHKPETIANFASLSVAAVFLSGRLRIPAPVAAVGLLLVSIYLATIRADSGLALNIGVLLLALLPTGKALPLGRVLQGLAGGGGLIAVLGVEFYIKNVLYPSNRFSDPLFELLTNLKSPFTLYCVCIALAPYFLIVFLALRRWKTLEAWESALLVASIVEFFIFMILALADEVRLFMPYPMALLPSSAALLCRELTGVPSQRSKLEPVAAQL
ncbi:MAG TPA: hypothetical protein VNW54_05555 [Granulicella sp.]|jgi:hypothetical protein|nr:hypothetical protein [Granulicella sp.]